MDYVRIDLEASLQTLTLGKKDTLRFTFTVVDDASESEAGIQPHQAFLRFYEHNGEEGIQPVKISSQGKGKFDLVRLLSILTLGLLKPNLILALLQNPRKPPPGLPPTSEGSDLYVDLILGSFTHDSSVIPLFKLELPASLPVSPHPEASHYAQQPSIEHTFRPPQKTPPRLISKVFTALAFSPWIVLLVMVSIYDRRLFSEPNRSCGHEPHLTLFVALAFETPCPRYAVNLYGPVPRSPCRFRRLTVLVLDRSQDWASSIVRRCFSAHYCSCWQKRFSFALDSEVW